MNCNNCGAPIREGASFCAKCGAPAAVPQQAAFAAAPPRSANVPYPGTQPAAAPPVGAYPPGAAPQPGIDWERLQLRKSPAGATALIAGVGLLLVAAALLIWGIAL